MVHGWAGRATQFRKFVPKLLEAGYCVLSFDAPAHGNSEGSKTDLEEFRGVISHLCQKVGNVKAAITHSFGGGAILYSISKGLRIPTVVNIGTPTIASEIINTFLRAVNGSQKAGEYFRKHLIKLTGKSFEEYTIMGFINEIPRDLHLMVVHDEDDKEAPVIHAKELSKVFAVELVITKGLGHTRILKDEAIIDKVVTFINDASSGR
jgi:hypothetical protein